MIESQIESNNFIGGEWVPSDSGETSETINTSKPSEVLGTTPSSGADEVSRAVDAAAKALPEWKGMLPSGRGAIMMKVADIIEEKTDELASLMARETGKPMGESLMEVARAAAIFRFYGSEGWRLEGANPPSTRPGVQISSVREPLGVIGLITPWNFPLAIPTWKMAPALITGNTIVIKPASNAALNAASLMQILSEAGIPDGVVNMVTGSGTAVGDPLVTDPRVKGISFTGSTSVGLGIQERAVGKKVQLEMGGKNPYVVMEDADLTDAAQKVAFSAFGYAGQKCTATSRAVVVEGVYDEFIEELKNATEATKFGDVMDDDTAAGPVVNKSQYDDILAAIETAKKDGRVVVDGGATGPEDDGYFINPVVVADVDNSSETAQEEIFGPVLAVIKARDFDHAVEIANDTRYGLTAGLATRSLRYTQEFAERSEVGIVNVNTPTAGVEFQVPFGGVKESGVGPKEQGKAGLDFYSTWKTVAIRAV